MRLAHSHSLPPSEVPSHAPRRREFLTWLSGGTTALALPGLLSACGGGGGAPGGPGGGDLSTEARMNTLAAVEAKSIELEAQPFSTLDRLHALAAFMAADSAYAEVGVEEGALCAWGVFIDGRVHIIDSSRHPVPEAVSRIAADPMPLAAASVELPKGKKARLLHSFGERFEGQTAVTKMSSWLAAEGYEVRSGREGDARLTTLRAVSGDGFFYINTHGGVKRTREDDKDSPLFFSIQSSTLVEPALENLPEMRDDFANQRLTYYNAPNGGENGERDTRYGITVHFVERYWSFEPDSVVIINACSSAHPRHATSFLNACLNKGAGVCLGWTEVTGDPVAYDAPMYLVDRMLGANKEQPESPWQRPFDWSQVLDEMRREGRQVFRHPETGVPAYFQAHSRDKVHVLAPSIHHLEVDEYKGILKLFGEFGSKQGTVVIKDVLGNHEAAIVLWTRTEVHVRLPQPTESGAHGAVVVDVEGHKSNERWLTMWTLRMRLLQHSPGSTALKVDGTSTVYLRADVAPTRDRPGQDPQKVRRYTTATGNSRFPLRASGSFSGITWSGDMDYRGVPLGVPAQVLSCRARLDAHGGTGSIGLAFGHGPGDGFLQSIAGIPDSRFGVNLGLLDGIELFPSKPEATPDLPLMALRFAFGPDYAVPARTFTDTVMALTIAWDRAEPLSAPTLKDRI